MIILDSRVTQVRGRGFHRQYKFLSFLSLLPQPPHSSDFFSFIVGFRVKDEFVRRREVEMEEEEGEEEEE